MPPPPTGPNSFVFTYVFTEKHLCQRLAPPPMRVGAPPRGNPGSAPASFGNLTLIACRYEKPNCHVIKCLRFFTVASPGKIIILSSQINFNELISAKIMEHRSIDLKFLRKNCSQYILVKLWLIFVAH